MIPVPVVPQPLPRHCDCGRLFNAYELSEDRSLDELLSGLDDLYRAHKHRVKQRVPVKIAAIIVTALPVVLFLVLMVSDFRSLNIFIAASLSVIAAPCLWLMVEVEEDRLVATYILAIRMKRRALRQSGNDITESK